MLSDPRKTVMLPVECQVNDESDLTTAVLTAGRWMEEQGATQAMKSKVMTIVSELGRNVLKYAVRGRVCCRVVDVHARHGVEIFVSDEGPGIEDIPSALEDSFSTGGTLGLGLPGVRRMVDDFDLQSTPGEGTRVTARIWLD